MSTLHKHPKWLKVFPGYWNSEVQSFNLQLIALGISLHVYDIGCIDNITSMRLEDEVKSNELITKALKRNPL